MQCPVALGREDKKNSIIVNKELGFSLWKPLKLNLRRFTTTETGDAEQAGDHGNTQLAENGINYELESPSTMILPTVGQHSFCDLL